MQVCLIVVLSALSMLNSKSESAEIEPNPAWKLVGVWQADVIEMNIPIRIICNNRPDGTYSAMFISPDGIIGGANGTWRFSDGHVYSTDEVGVRGKGRVVFINDNVHEVTIIDNGVPADTGKKRRYVRQ